MADKKKIVVFSGAGLDRESGILTFRDCKDGLWNNYKIDEVATPTGWKKDPQKVLDFYNERRRELPNVSTNRAHTSLAELENGYDVTHVTQNVSDLLERAGATKVYHLHGELTKVRASKPKLKSFNKPIGVTDIGYKDINLGDLSEENGEQLRPHIVWFDEMPEYVAQSSKAIQEADILIIVGTSLNISYTLPLLAQANTIMGDNRCKAYYVDPDPSRALKHYDMEIEYVTKSAVKGISELVTKLIAEATKED